MLQPLVLLFGLASTAHAARAVDAGRPMPSKTPRVLVVQTPGWTAEAWQPLVDAVEAAGLDAWTVTLGLPEQHDPVAALDEARQALGPHALVGHGLGGTVAATSAAHSPPLALGLLGVPLAPPRSAALDHLRALPAPTTTVDPAAFADHPWQGRPLIPLLLGTPLPSLGPVSADWVGWLRDWQSPVDLSGTTFPVWAGLASLDELGQVEACRPGLPDTATVVRFGPLRGEARTYDHADLLSSPNSRRALSRWLRRSLTGRQPPDA